MADISLYTYTHSAADGGLALTQYQNLLDWLNRIEALPNFVAM
ncbi:hypothetical protein [Psychrobacter pygoscelis]|nr:hypothetical protein [Psychrobacter pygoscelis]